MTLINRTGMFKNCCNSLSVEFQQYSLLQKFEYRVSRFSTTSNDIWPPWKAMGYLLSGIPIHTNGVIRHLLWNSSQLSHLEIPCLQGVSNYDLCWPCISNFQPPPNRKQNRDFYLSKATNAISFKVLANIFLVRYPALIRGVHTFTPLIPQITFTSLNQNTQINCGFNDFKMNIFIRKFSCGKLPLTSLKKQKCSHTQYSSPTSHIYSNFPSWDVVFTRFYQFDLSWVKITF